MSDLAGYPWGSNLSKNRFDPPLAVVTKPFYYIDRVKALSWGTVIAIWGNTSDSMTSL
jgi:hypothetical protein